MNTNYILDESKNPISCDDALKWAEWNFKDNNRTVAKTDVLELCLVSTVFLGIDHSYTMGGPPVLFETMIFPDERCTDDLPDDLADYQERYCTWDEAVEGHKIAVAKFREYFDLQRQFNSSAD